MNALRERFRNQFKISKTCGEVGKVMFITSVVVTLVGYGFALAADATQNKMRNSKN